MKAHYDAVHIAEKKFKCACGKSFTRKSVLERHQNTHITKITPLKPPKKPGPKPTSIKFKIAHLKPSALSSCSDIPNEETSV
jgi:uncharacterized Zn-finger protein